MERRWVSFIWEGRDEGYTHLAHKWTTPVLDDVIRLSRGLRHLVDGLVVTPCLHQREVASNLQEVLEAETKKRLLIHRPDSHAFLACFDLLPPRNTADIRQMTHAHTPVIPEERDGVHLGLSLGAPKRPETPNTAIERVQRTASKWATTLETAFSVSLAWSVERTASSCCSEPPAPGQEVSRIQALRFYHARYHQHATAGNNTPPVLAEGSPRVIGRDPAAIHV